MVLYHGSRNKIDSAHLRPSTPDDPSGEENQRHAVYATDREDIAWGMSLVGDPGTKAMGDYHEESYKTAFVEGQPEERIRYLYVLDDSTFAEEPKGSHQFLSYGPVRILEVKEKMTSDLDKFWREATSEEKEKYYGFKPNRL